MTPTADTDTQAAQAPSKGADSRKADLLQAQPMWARPPEEEAMIQRPSRTHPDDAHPLLNPYASYTVTTHNKEFAAEVHGVRFLNGEAEVRALTPAATDEEIARRRNFLHYVFNARQTIVPTMGPNPQTGKWEQIGSTRHPTFVVTPK